jgi:oxygen-independent coproporphyrinogen-3 oxidase
VLEESFFLGLRLNRGVNIKRLREEFGSLAGKYDAAISELAADGLLQRSGDNLRLTPRGRLLSNEVFERFIEDRQSTSSTRD